MAAIGNNEVGITGVLWGADLQLYPYGQGRRSVRDPFRRFEQALADAARRNVRVMVTSLPFGDVAHEDEVSRLRQSLRQYLSAGNVFVLAAGEDTSGGDGRRWTLDSLRKTTDPGLTSLDRAAAQLLDTFPDQIFIVSGTDSSNRFWGPSDFYTGGTRIVAPATDILTLADPADFPTGTAVGRGNSFAAPFVAGVAGLLWAMEPRLTAAQVKDYILRGARQPRVNPQTGQIAAPPPAGVLGGEAVYQLDAYGALTLLASKGDYIPLCGNRVWTSNDIVYAERDTATHRAEPLVRTLWGQQAWYANARHGGRRVDVFGNDSGPLVFALEQGQWRLTQWNDTLGAPGGTYLSVNQTSHDQDSGVVYSTVGDGIFHIKILWDSSRRQTPLTDLSVLPLIGPSGTTCLRLHPPDSTGNRECAEYTWTGSSEGANLTLAYSPVGDEIAAAVTRRLMQFTGTGGYQPCPGSAPEDTAPPLCRDAYYRDDSKGSEVRLYRIQGGQQVAQWAIAGKDVFWLAVSEDGAQVAVGEGALSYTVTLGAFGAGVGPQQFTNCGVAYRAYRTGTELRTLIPIAGGACADQGRGTISPVVVAPP